MGAYVFLLCLLGCFCCGRGLSSDSGGGIGMGFGSCWLAIIVGVVLLFAMNFAKPGRDWNTALMFGAGVVLLICLCLPGAGTTTYFAAAAVAHDIVPLRRAEP